MELLRGLGLVLFGVSLTWLLTVVLGRAASRRGFALWVWDRSGSIGRVLIVVGFGLAAFGPYSGGSEQLNGQLAAVSRGTDGDGRDLAHPAGAVDLRSR